MVPWWLAQADGAALTNACGDDPGWLCEWVYDATGNETLAKLALWFVGRPVKIGLIFLVTWVAATLVRRWVRRFGETYLAGQVRLKSEITASRQARITTLTTVGASTAGVFVWLIGIVTVLSALGVSLGPLLAAAGVAGAALGFGAQSVVRDFLSGFFMLFEGQFDVGDTIDTGEATGVVELITLRRTQLRGVDGTIWHVPNGEIRRVGNQSPDWSRAVVDIGVGPATDLDEAQRIILTASERTVADPEVADDILEAPELLGVESVGGEGSTIRLRIKTLPGAQYKVARAVRAAVKADLDAAGIEPPLPPGALRVPPPPATGR